MKHHAKDVPFILVGSKIDLRDDENYVKQHMDTQGKPITTAEGQALMKEIGAIEYFECSAKLNKGIHEIFERIVRLVINQKPKKAGNGGKCLIL